jgi:hypothetical protein
MKPALEPFEDALLQNRFASFQLRQPESTSWSNRAKRSLMKFAAMLCIVIAGPNLAGAEDMSVHVAALRKKVPAFTIVEQSPFVVVGDEPAAMVQMRATRIVKWAVDLLKRDYFAKDPEEIIDVWLFKDKESYEKHTLEIFGDKPGTPYGYYSQHHRALIMNIATGGGTLVHEIVHPYMRANFPDCPPWFNEGMGSLYEQSMEKDGRIRGLTNWRLPRLQQGIKAGRLLSFEQLTALNTADFYGEVGGYSSYYGQSRYLCYYLQEKELLVKFYREFVANAKADPTGLKTLQKILGESDMVAFQKKWEAYVATLQFP